MALAFKAACHIYTVCPIFNGLEQVYYINPCRCTALDCLDIAGIREPSWNLPVRQRSIAHIDSRKLKIFLNLPRHISSGWYRLTFAASIK